MKKVTTGVLIVLLASATSCARNEINASACIDPDKIDPNTICTMQYEPVCGCDGQTYSNPCMANKAGVTTYTEGACNGAQ